MKPPCKRHELAGLTEECFCPAAPVVLWTYAPAPKWGQDVATCTVVLGGRSARWQAEGIYISDDERIEVPKRLTDGLRLTIKLFGEIHDDE